MLWSNQELLAVRWLQHPKWLYPGFLIAIHVPESACKIFRHHIPLVGLLSCSANNVQYIYSVFLVWAEAGCKSLQKLSSVCSRSHALQYNQGKGVGAGKWVVHNARIVTTHVSPYQLSGSCCLFVLCVCRWP
jgi:hypothetical protein